MINQLLLGACVAVIAVSLSAPAMVSTRGSRIESEPRQVLAPKSTKQDDDNTRRAEPTSEDGFLGVVVALQSVELSAKFDGTLERLDVHVGDRVKRGAPIARLDGRSIARDLAMSEASLRVAEAEHDRLVVELEDAADHRSRLQRISNLVAREQIVAAESQEKIAAARLRSAAADLSGKRERIDQLKETSRDVQIVSPFDGTIAARYVESGTTVSRSTPIVRIINPTSLVIRFAVPEEQAASVTVGRSVTVHVPSVDLTADGVLESIVPEIDAALRMVVVEARLSVNPDRAYTIPFGATARVLFPVDANHQGHDTARVHPSRASRREPRT